MQATANSDGTTDLDMGEFVLEKTKNSEYIPSPASLRSVFQSSDNEDNVPILATFKPKDNVPTLVTLKPRDNVRPVVDRYSSDSEGDEVPISQIIQALKAICDVVPEGEAAVDVSVARDFGKDLGNIPGKGSRR